MIEILLRICSRKFGLPIQWFLTFLLKGRIHTIVFRRQSQFEVFNRASHHRRLRLSYKEQGMFLSLYIHRWRHFDIRFIKKMV